MAKAAGHLCFLTLCIVLFLPGCSVKQQGVGKPVSWKQLPGWQQDKHASTWPAFLQSCKRLSRQGHPWSTICATANNLENPDDTTVRNFFETWFVPYIMIGEDGRHQGLITGYYEPILLGSLKPTKRFRYPLYRRPKNLLRIDLGELYPELKGKVVRGLLDGNRVIPFHDRNNIDNNKDLLKGNELLWVDDPVALFFLHIQGSGRIQLRNGKTVAVGYADQNGHPYVAIGRVLIERGILKREEVSLQSIRAWLKNNPEQMASLLHENPSYIFFVMRESTTEGPLGTLNVPLTAGRSIAVDREFIPLGHPVWLDTELPNDSDKTTPFRKLMFAQDTGGAISGAVRADVFWGRGQEADPTGTRW